MAHRWLLLALILLSAGGGFELASPRSTIIDEREQKSYLALRVFQAGFDAVSATTGGGLLLRDFGEQYTPHGRWVLTSLSVAGAILFIAAWMQAWRRAIYPRGGRAAPGRIAGAYGAQLGLIVVILVFWRLTGGDAPLVDLARCGLTAWAGSGFAGDPGARLAWLPLGVTSIVSGVGFLAWPLVERGAPANAEAPRRNGTARAAIGAAGGVVLLALLVTLLETPKESGRGVAPGPAVDATASRALHDRPAVSRFGASVLQTAAAASAGVATAPIADRSVSDGTKVLLAAAMWSGGLPGSPGGGMKWPLWAGCLLLGWCVLRGRFALRPARGEQELRVLQRLMLAGAITAVLLAALVLTVTAGLLVFLSLFSSPFEAPPTFADVLLDATSAVCGGNISSGVTGVVTSPNLSRGLGQSVDVYFYGIVWIVLAMLAGRVLPVWSLERARRMAASVEACPSSES